MVRQVVGVALLALIAGACSSTPLDTSEQGVAEAQTGSVSLPLTTQVGDTQYRLNLATFTIIGPGIKPRVVKPPADEPVHNEVLPIGSYFIQLEKGWVLEKLAPGAKVWAAVPAQLVTANPLSFDVTTKGPADAFFGFATVSGDITLGNGSVNIRIGVQDCSSYDQYMAALGELTAECLGTVDPRAYEINNGVIRPTFSECPGNPAKLRSIKQLLSLQLRTARLPFAKQCISDRFAVAQQKFLSSGVTECGKWTFAGYVNEITDKTIITVIRQGLPELPAPDDVRPDPKTMELLKQQSFYRVQMDTAGQKCETPGACAQICAAAFPGLVQSADGESVITDPTGWLVDTLYPNGASTDPYLRAGYYHPMSYYGPLPGALFGEYARFEPCGPGVSCSPELCSYFAGSHIKTFLQKDCLDPTNVDTCVSYCGPKL